MSITAFPVLARILEDRNLSQTALESDCYHVPAVDDVTAWCILALVIAIVRSAGDRDRCDHDRTNISFCGVYDLSGAAATGSTDQGPGFPATQAALNSGQFSRLFWLAR